MRTSQRKAQEVAERDQALVRLALDMISRDGFHNLTLGKLAQEAGYSKGTVYGHFTCREDLLIELSAESARRQLRYFQAIADLPWTGVRALYGMAFAYMRHAVVAPVLFECSITARTDAVCRLASEDRLTRRDLVESQMEQVVGFVVQRTVSEGAYANPDVSTGVAVDALRAYILGYAAMHLLSRRFLWADAEQLDDRLAVMTSMMSGLGWPRLEKAELAEIHQVVVDVVDGITKEYEANS
ncbi:helix-turn-helix domain-containing protein [Streptomyces sp. NPDC052676]|uniref:TetR/AcrR family transcriptional regulator n=1 Tax=Streptomyces sp. NPDC052676 TaxID=3154953 RepID=UPI00344543D9